MTYSIDILSNPILVKRVGEWVNIPLSLPSIRFESLSSATLNYRGGSSLNSSGQAQVLSVYLLGERTDMPIGLDSTTITTGFTDISSISGSLFHPDAIVSIRTSGSTDSWLSIEALSLELDMVKDVAPVTGNLMIHTEKHRYRGNKEGAKFQRFSHEVIGACSDFVINKSTVPSWDGGSLSEYYTLMSVSTEFQHLRRVLRNRV